MKYQLPGERTRASALYRRILSYEQATTPTRCYVDPKLESRLGTSLAAKHPFDRRHLPQHFIQHLRDGPNLQVARIRIISALIPPWRSRCITRMISIVRRHPIGSQHLSTEPTERHIEQVIDYKLLPGITLDSNDAGTLPNVELSPTHGHHNAFHQLRHPARASRTEDETEKLQRTHNTTLSRTDILESRSRSPPGDKLSDYEDIWNTID